jgi:energy-coupling factor transporter ATP-binding protein EcfA2
MIDGVQPTFDSIADGKYPVSRPAVLLRQEGPRGHHPRHQRVPGRVHQRKSLGSGRLPGRQGLIPMPDAERKQFASDIMNLKPFPAACSSKQKIGPAVPCPPAILYNRAVSKNRRIRGFDFSTRNTLLNSTKDGRESNDRAPVGNIPNGAEWPAHEAPWSAGNTGDRGHPHVDNPRMDLPQRQRLLRRQARHQECFLDIGRNEVIAMIGPSGCGKSTFLRCLNRMNDTIDGCRVTGSITAGRARTSTTIPRSTWCRCAPRSAWCSRSPTRSPNPSTTTSPTARASMAWPPQSRTRRMVETSLIKAGLWEEVKDRLDQPGTGLSGGQQQRLCIARTIAVSRR